MLVTLYAIFVKLYEGDNYARISYGIKEEFAEQTWRLPEEFFFSSKEELIENCKEQAEYSLEGPVADPYTTRTAINAINQGCAKIEQTLAETVKKVY